MLEEDVPAFAERLRPEKGKNIWLVGGAELVAAFLDFGQVDEFVIHYDGSHVRELARLTLPGQAD